MPLEKSSETTLSDSTGMDSLCSRADGLVPFSGLPDFAMGEQEESGAAWGEGLIEAGLTTVLFDGNKALMSFRADAVLARQDGVLLPEDAGVRDGVLTEDLAATTISS